MKCKADVEEQFSMGADCDDGACVECGYSEEELTMDDNMVQLVREAWRLNNELTAVLIQLNRYMPKEEEWTDEEKAIAYFAKNMFGIMPDLEDIRQVLD